MEFVIGDIRDFVEDVSLCLPGVEEAVPNTTGTHSYLRSRFLSIPALQAPITEMQIRKLISMCLAFETKNRHSEALNSPLIGVVPMYFTTADSDAMFLILGVSEEEISGIIKKADFIQPSWYVLSDPYNHMVMLTVHRIFVSKVSEKLKHDGMIAMLKMLQYKFFTSFVNHCYKFRADEKTMTYVINQLSNKYDLVKYGTWLNVIKARSEDIISQNSIHREVIEKYHDDHRIVVVLVDVQTRIRQKIRLINQLYHEAKEKGIQVGEYTLLDQIDGQKLIQHTSSAYDTMINGMMQQIQSFATFVDYELIDVLTSRFKNISPELFRVILGMFVDKAFYQSQNRHTAVTKITINGVEEPVYLSCSMIVREIIQKTYRYIVHTGGDTNSKSAIILRTMNIYTSSRISDPDILTIKRSVVYFVTSTGKTVRDATIAALAIEFILYVIIRSFMYI